MSRSNDADRLRLWFFTAATPGGAATAPWDHPDALSFDYKSLSAWSDLARKLEAACFDAIFWADNPGFADVYGGSRDSAVREAVQVPSLDPAIVAAALAGATEHIGLSFTSSLVQKHPFTFAREMSTIDHLTNGRVGWNMVTSFLENSWRNHGFAERASHEQRYVQLQEYVDVLYKLLEGSWEPDAVVRDTKLPMFADPSKVHQIDHVGDFYAVDGPHLCEPSPQRVPMLFQAGTSSDGKAFAARNAEVCFIRSTTKQGAAKTTQELRSLAANFGRRPEDLLVFNHLNVIVGGTEEEAKRKEAEAAEHWRSEWLFTFMSGTLGTDLSTVDIDSPIHELDIQGIQGSVRGMIEAAPDKSISFRDYVLSLVNTRTAGTPEQIADEIQGWWEAGVQGLSVGYVTGTSEIYNFVEQVVPELQRRGLMQREYTPGTLREKVFGPGYGPLLNDRHPASKYRR